MCFISSNFSFIYINLLSILGQIEIPKGFYNFSEKFMILKLFKQKIISSLPDFIILNELDKHFDDEEDIEKDKELYQQYFNENNFLNNIDYVLEPQNIPKKIKELRKNHRYLYQSDIKLVCNYLNYMIKIKKV